LSLSNHDILFFNKTIFYDFISQQNGYKIKNMIQGTVITFDDTKGRGLIKTCDGRLCHVMREDIQPLTVGGESHLFLSPGQQVKFHIQQNGNEWIATDIRRTRL